MRRLVFLAAVASLGSTAALASRPGSRPVPPRPAPAAPVPAAAADPTRPGTARLCASDLVNFDDTPSLAVPAGLVFTAWGRAGAADLRALRLDPNYPPARSSGQTAFVLDAPVALTAASPCAAASVRAVVSARHAWRAGTLQPGDGMVYQALDTLAGTDTRPLSAETHDLYDLLTMNVLTAQIVEPVTTAATIR